MDITASQKNVRIMHATHKYWYDVYWVFVFFSYETRRVILKQGHPPSMFYIMLTGTAIVNILDEDPRTGNKFIRTVHELNGGETFGVNK